MRRFVVAASIALLVIMSIGSTVSAARGWCARDPIVELDGVEYQLIVSIPWENVPQVNGELLFEFSSPKGTQRELIFEDEGFNGYGERIEFKDGAAANAHTFFMKIQRTGSDFPALLDVYRNGTLIASKLGDSNGISITVPIGEGALDNTATTILNLDGTSYQIEVTTDQSSTTQVNGDMLVEVSSPDIVSQQIIAATDGFNGYGQDVMFRTDSSKAHSAFIKLQRSGNDFPVTVTVYKNGAQVASQTGTSNGVNVSFSR